MMPSCDVLLTWGSICRSISAFGPFLWVGTGRQRPHRPGARRNPAPPGTPLSGVGSRALRFVPNEPGQQPGYQRHRPRADQPPETSENLVLTRLATTPDLSCPAGGPTP